MDEYKKICIKEIINIIIDGGWHDIYSFHNRHRIPIKIIFNAINELLSADLILKAGMKIRIKEELSNKDLKKLNFYYKTKKPKVLNYHKDSN